jgi:polysaccharide export outer membrane protein
MVSGCGTPGENAPTTMPSEPFTASDSADPSGTAEGGDRPIAGEDVLQITIVGERNEQTTFPVTASGYIQFPYLDMVKVAGMTAPEVKRMLEKRLVQEGYFTNPQVLVTVAYHEQYVKVLGAVRQPGLVVLKGDRKMDILDVISAAGGVTPLAKNEVEYTHNGVLRKISLEDLKKAGPRERIWVHPDDIIEVKEGIW